MRGLTRSATPAGTLGASGLEKALGRFPLLCKGSESGVRRGRDLGWTAAPEGRPGRLAQVPRRWVTCPPQPCSPPRPPHSAQPRTPPGCTSPPLGPWTPSSPGTPPASDTPGPMVRGMGVSRPPVRRSREGGGGGGGPLPLLLPQAQSRGPAKHSLSSPSSARTRAPLSPLTSAFVPCTPAYSPAPPTPRQGSTDWDGSPRTGEKAPHWLRPQRESRFSKSLGQELAGGDGPSPATSFTRPHQSRLASLGRPLLRSLCLQATRGGSANQ